MNATSNLLLESNKLVAAGSSYESSCPFLLWPDVGCRLLSDARMMWKVSKWNLKKAKLWPQSVELREWPRFSIVDLPHLPHLAGRKKGWNNEIFIHWISTGYPVLDKPTFFPHWAARNGCSILVFYCQRTYNTYQYRLNMLTIFFHSTSTAYSCLLNGVIW